MCSEPTYDTQDNIYMIFWNILLFFTILRSKNLYLAFLDVSLSVRLYGWEKVLYSSQVDDSFLDGVSSCADNKCVLLTFYFCMKYFCNIIIT